MKIIYKFIIITSLTVFFLISYLSLFGIETNKFNSQISSKIKEIDNDLEIDLKKIKLILNPFKLKLNIKTVGSKLIKQNKVIEIENIKTQISLRSLIENKFLIENVEISTKSIEIRNLISFIRTFYQVPELYILEQTIKKGYLIADIKLEFDEEGKIKDSYTVKGFFKDNKVSLFKKYSFNKLNFIFSLKKNEFILKDLTFSLNELNFFSKKISIIKSKDEFLIKGNINNKSFELDNEKTILFIKPFLPSFDIQKIKFGSENIFSFKLNKKFKLKDFEISSKILIDEFSIPNILSLKKFFPKAKKNIFFSDHELSLEYKKDNLLINGNGNILYQDKNDFVNYVIKKKKKNLDFKTSFKINDNPFVINFLNYKKSQKDEASIKIEGVIGENNLTLIKLFHLKEGKNKVEIKNLVLNKSYEIINFDKVNLDYIDKDNQTNLIKLHKKKDEYYLESPFFNADKLIDELINDEENNSNILKIDNKINININKIRIDNEYNLINFSGYLFLKDKKIIKADLIGNFSENRKLKFTVSTKDNNKITTLYVDKARPIVRRYKFIKGFDEGSLDFYSSKNFNESISTLKIYNFKLKELPALTKILTLASLQGIADILSGEGIRFDEFEMNFKNKGNLMTIDEIFAIGPAISILMDGYVEKNKLISLRGTLVPATTINKFISSLPILGKILVGSKTGEGVFGVSFKIKGHPKKLETSVNPIKTLTPRFITRTLEKIKKN
jgi:hypothetical protein